jgi:hypothetical protein
MTEDDDLLLTRPQRRALRRIYNGRTAPIMIDGQAFLTFKAARQFLLSLDSEAREAAYLAMRAQADQAASSSSSSDATAAAFAPSVT